MDILILIVFLLLYSVSSVLSMLIHYYYRILVPGRENYKREELVNIGSILKEEFELIFSGQEKQYQFLGLALGSFIGFIMTYFGGIYGDHYESYFFHSAILPVILYFGFGFIHKNNLAKDMPGPIRWILQYDFSIFIGFSLTTLTKIMLVYGIYHVISFIWIFPNIIGMFVLIIARIVEKLNKEDYKLVFRSKTSDN